MAKRIVKMGKWYLAYELCSTAAIVGLAWYGVNLPALV